MGDFARKSDGRRIFTTEYKRQQVERIRSGETTAAALSRELSVAPALVRKWIKLSEHGSAAAVDADEDVVPASRVRELERQLKDLQRLVGKQAMTIEILEAAREVVKKSPRLFKGSRR
jgi:transposase